MKSIIILLVIFLCICSPLFFIGSGKISFIEIRLYVFVFFIIMAVIGFSVLRLYNSVVQNSKAIYKLFSAYKALIFAINKIEKALGKAFSVQSALIDVLKKLSAKIDNIVK